MEFEAQTYQFHFSCLSSMFSSALHHVSCTVAAHMSQMCPDGEVAEPLLELIRGGIDG